MLRLLFWILIAANGVLFAFRMGYLDSLIGKKGEPQRMTAQLNADQIKLVPPGKPEVPPAVATTHAPEAPQKLVACTEVGNFTAREAGIVEARLRALAPGDRLKRREKHDVASYMVYIPPQASKVLADKKAGQLKHLGVANFFIIKDDPRMRWAISLGVFKTEAAAKRHLANLQKQGVRSAKVGARSITGTQIAYELRDLDPANLQALQQIMADFPQRQSRDCSKN